MISMFSFLMLNTTCIVTVERHLFGQSNYLTWTRKPVGQSAKKKTYTNLATFLHQSKRFGNTPTPTSCCTQFGRELFPCQLISTLGNLVFSILTV